MYKKKQIFFLDNLQKDKISDTKIALEIEEVSYDNLIIQFLHYNNNGEIVKNNEVYLDCFEGKKFVDVFWIEINFEPKQETNKRYLKVNYGSHYSNKSTCIDISGDSVSRIVSIIYRFLVFCRKHKIEIEKYGFRENINFNFVNVNKSQFLIRILNIKTYRLKTSLSIVRKDNLFEDYMVIQFDKYDSIYLLKLISNFLVSKEHDKEKMTFTHSLGRTYEWSPSFSDRIVEDNFQGYRASIMRYIIKKYNTIDALKTTLLNIDF